MYNWDPLSSLLSNKHEELISAVRKREISNILKSYVGIYDPFCELIQNAMDAVDTRKRELNEPNYQKKIWVKINLKDNSMSVTDNGIGFKEDEFKLFLCPNVSFKDSKKNRGNKGVGSTYLAYGFNFLQIGTKSKDFSILTEIKNGRNWIEDKDGTVTRPIITESELTHSQFSEIDRGSTFSIKFEGKNIRPKDLNWFSANTANQWKHILLIKTPLGQVSTNSEDDEGILFDIEVIDKDGSSTQLINEQARYIYPHQVISACADLKLILAEQDKFIKKGEPVRTTDKYLKLNGIYENFTTNELIENLNITDQSQKDLLHYYSITAYGYFCYSTKIWDVFNDDQIKLRKGTRILKGGIQLATNNMPQGELITIPLTSNIGYQNQSHIVIHFKNADPDLGRKGFQPELEELAKEVSKNIVSRFKKWRKNLREDTGAMPTIIHQSQLDDWIDKQRDYERSAPLFISNKNFFLPMKEISITSRPASEQDTIVLFSQLLAGGVIRGFKLMATDQHSKYDGVFRYYINEPRENFIFNEITNPLGVKEESLHPNFTLSKPFVMEYKHNVDGLIHDFENEVKNEIDIHLVVAWETGEEWRKRYNVTSLLDLDNIHHRQFHGLTHIFRDEKTSEIKFFGIILSDLIEYLNDVEGVQELQKKKYD